MDGFLGTLKGYYRFIKGFGGQKTTNVKIGTIKWSWLDETILTHEFRIPNSLFSIRSSSSAETPKMVLNAVSKEL